MKPNYEYTVGFHKGAFQALLNLRNVIENFKHSPHSKLIQKKMYNLLLSYINVAIENIDEFMDYGGINYIIIDKDNNCRRVSEEEANQFIADNQKQYWEKHKGGS